MRVNDVWELTPQRAAIHLPTATAVIADVHLGYGQARRRRGDAVPLIPVEEHLARLAPILAEHAVRRLAIAGDLFEGQADADIVRELLAWLRDVRLELTGIVPGNHDLDIEDHWQHLPLYPDGLPLGEWTVVHGDRALPSTPVVQGHAHPCFRLGGELGAPCFLVSPRRIILPAFSPDAAGVNVLSDSAWSELHCLVCSSDKVLDFGPARQWQKSKCRKSRPLDPS
jgi:putative SbcD/Mre11-related phosphoesterase